MARGGIAAVLRSLKPRLPPSSSALLKVRRRGLCEFAVVERSRGEPPLGPSGSPGLEAEVEATVGSPVDPGLVVRDKLLGEKPASPDSLNMPVRSAGFRGD
jgi:hypothetical protein